MSYRKKPTMLGPTYEQEIELRIAEAYERKGYVYKRQNIKPIEFRDLALPSPEDMHKMRYAIKAFMVKIAAHLAAEADPEIARINAQMHVARDLDQLREKDPAAAALQIEFVRRMCKQMGLEPPYPF